MAGVGDAYVWFVTKARYGIILFWLAALGVGIVYGPQYLNYTSGHFKPPPGTQAYTSSQAYETLFPAAQNKGTLIVMVSSSDEAVRVDTSPWVKTFTVELAEAIEQYSASHSGDGKFVHSIAGFWLLVGGNYTGLAEQYVSPSGESTIISISYATNLDKRVVPDFIDFLETASGHAAVTASAAVGHGAFSYGVTGQDALWKAGEKATKQSLARMDTVALPLALFILASYLRSIRIMIIPLIALGTSMMTGFMIMYPVARYKWTVAQVAPNIQGSLALALSIDYSLFLLTRFKEEILVQGKDPVDAISVMCRTASRVVLVSGSTLTIAFLGLAFFPLAFLQSIGIGAAVTLFCTISVNLTLTPAILLTFPNFFGQFGVYDFILVWWARMRGQAPRSVAASPETRPLLMSDPEYSRSIQGTATTPVNGEPGLFAVNAAAIGSDPLVAGEKVSKSKLVIEDPIAFKEGASRMLWFSSSKYTARTLSAAIIIVVVVAVLVPFAVQVKDLHITADSTQVFPRDAPALKLFHAFQTLFPPGLISPYHVLAVPPAHFGSVLTPQYFNFTATLTQVLTKAVPLKDLTSLTMVNGVEVSLPEAAAYLSYKGPGGPGASDFAKRAYVYQANFGSLVNSAHSAATVKVLTPFDPLGEEAKPWLSSVRALLASSHELDSYRGTQYSALYVLGGNTVVIDTMDRIFKLFPYVALATAVVIFAIVAILYRSLVVPVRLLFTIALPIGATLGLAVMIFQKGNFDKLAESVLSQSKGIYWLVPVMSIPICMGLMLDYQIFILSRIAELRRAGFDHYSSVRLGVSSAGTVVSVAGVIMAVAFGSLLIAEELLLMCLGFILCFAVLLDTLLIRPVIVPAAVWLSGDINWWPSRMPEPHVVIPW
ncbi:MMPL domain-containing protein [Thecamonas trahens ATCC 50062]|uniref:MMPL domain-containing protein n=1 Tax=Thecamonas trahens ATCC 50062 TaxID=461836 RepID=A0A0L0D1I9_THETB|nr:MMPL domain-containing protein [Thecamonas trahens ATCC 50062]KNC46005.1 MMPL domain-containing protein [Thecamonas trahens ATCC 50062]|eukprot:XP_013762985.1 MMPL domain-containing protein [Thecamonas trahens ATCC 50062]